MPPIQILSNGNYTVCLSAAGAGFSKFGENVQITRWREDAVRDCRGSFCFARDLSSGAVWSAGGWQPIQSAEPEFYEVSFNDARAEFTRHDAGILSRSEIVVDPDENAELRRVSLTNLSNEIREIELTTYAEIVLTRAADDLAQTAFSNLMIETEVVSRLNAILARRRPRDLQKEKEVWGIHALVRVDEETTENDGASGKIINQHGLEAASVEFETSREQFVGRGQTVNRPKALFGKEPLSNFAGIPLDPIWSLRRKFKLAPGQTVSATFLTGTATTRTEAERLAARYRDPSFEQVAEAARAAAQNCVRELELEPIEAATFQNLAARLIFSDEFVRAAPEILKRNSGSQKNLWAYGISGDFPIVVVEAAAEKDFELLRELLRAHKYLRRKSLRFDLVIINRRGAGYEQNLQDELFDVVGEEAALNQLDKPGGIFIRREDLIQPADRILLLSAARAYFAAGTIKTLAEIVRVQNTQNDKLTESFAPDSEIEPESLKNQGENADDSAEYKPSKLEFFNGLGGVDRATGEYVVRLEKEIWTPAPWSNVVANRKDFGFLITETGACCAWRGNSRENRLTPWSNDAASDQSGEVFYLRDDRNGEFWSPTPLPARDSEPYTIRHGHGVTIFGHQSGGIEQNLTVFAALDEPVKISVLRLTNKTADTRRFSIFNYIEPVLGFAREQTARFITTEYDQQSNALFARNPYRADWGESVAFLAASAGKANQKMTYTCDRREFIGRNRGLENPAALHRKNLSNRAGTGFDSCLAVQTTIEMLPEATETIVFLFGECDHPGAARKLIERYDSFADASEELHKVQAYWGDLLGTIQVKTPNRTFDEMVNNRLLYQTLACRVSGRTAFYQSSGAYGFRDQLQDVCALLYAAPEIARAQILLHAARQFKEGNAQHWWHPPGGKGVRTRCSDDYLWLPYAAALYAKITLDYSIFDEIVNFLDAPVLQAGQDDSYFEPAVSAEKGSIYEHCTRAIDRALSLTGANNLPLMGAGDWNDGMNHVGILGKGESVWLGFFLSRVLQDFGEICERRQDFARLKNYRLHEGELKTALENAWDGAWYRRAYFDDGTPLGSNVNDECRIDSIAQSWSVISGAADPQRAKEAMNSVSEILVDRQNRVVRLLFPPFVKNAPDPGYIGAYPPDVRENGGQYTHAAAWAIIAFARLGDAARAMELFDSINPLLIASDEKSATKYRVEPYAIAGDVYSGGELTGRGGWTWYTGAAGWLYRAALEEILGFKLTGNLLTLTPQTPPYWTEFEIKYRRGNSLYLIKAENLRGGANSKIRLIEIDGKVVSTDRIELADTGKTHEIRFIFK